ncbi:MAG: hypothetical protein HC866_23525 [Leptolyngbyaceae cyanobacterium RU_5_1]|nr:hypothetical protein [Leptolyngbyaceae cyanobacterium RU_5_1]
MAPAKKSQSAVAYSPAQPPSVNPLLVPQRRRAAQNSSTSVSEQALLEQSIRDMTPPETISSRSERSEPSMIPLTTSLTDVEGHWAQYYIEFLANRQIVQGFPNGRFRPDRPVTAAEFVTMTRRAFQDSSPISYRDLQSVMANRAVTRAEAAAFIYRALVKSEPAPIVTSIQVQGAVARPGAYSLAAASDERIGRGNNFPTVSRAIQQAGGSLGSANLRQVEIHRLTEAGTQKVIKVDVSQVWQTGNLTQDVMLQQDDKLVIPAIAPSAQGIVDAPVSQ